MKRSEMLGKIRETLEGRPRADDYAEEILSTVEQLGMIPPYYYRLITDPDDLFICGPGPISCKGWENE